MKPERWKQVEELYYATCAQPRAERAAFLAGTCPDAELRREVESLLEEPDAVGGFLSGPAAAMAAHLVSDSSAAAMTGRSIGGYHLQTLLGAGGMGEVYRSHDTKLQRDVAIKILPGAFANDPDRLARFEREARMLAALNHPNICAIFGLEETEGVRFLVLELVEGETLREKLAHASDGKGLPLRSALGIARQMADALEAAHEKGIIHRDLKPTNVKITPDGVVKVLDFGLAKSVGADGSMPGLPDVTAAPGTGRREGAVMGTAAYMSPEQARGQTVDKRTDIWAFGCVLYEMLTGRVPFAGDTGSDIIAKILERDPDWAALPAATPAHIRKLLRRCLTKDPKQRLRDIGDVRLEIDENDAAVAPVRTGTRWLPWVALAALAAAVGIWEIRRPPAAPENASAPFEDPLAGAKITAITNWPGDEGSAEVSPNGEVVAILADVDGDWDVFLTQVGTDEFYNLTSDIPSVGSPSPLLRNIGFNAASERIWFSRQEERKLTASNSPTEPKLSMPLTGGTKTQLLYEDTEAPAWSPDGKSLAYFATDKGPDDLFVADSTGAERRKILEDQPRGMHNHNPVWSADSQWIYFAHGTDPNGKMDLMRVRPSEGSQPEILTTQYGVGFIAPLDERTLLYVARAEDRSGPWLYSLDINTHETRRVLSGLLEQITSVSASTDGRRIVVTVAKPGARLFRVPLRLDRVARESDVELYALKSERALAPRFFRNILFYLSSLGAGDALWRWDGQEATPIRRPENVALSEPAAVSRTDGRVAVVVYDKQGGKRHLEIMENDGSKPLALAAAASIDIGVASGQGAADWSPDGKFIVAGGTDASGKQGLFKIPVTGGDPVVPLVLGKRALSPVWSPDNKLIVYSGGLVRGQVTLYGVTPDGDPVEVSHILDGKVVEVRARTGGYRFMPDDKHAKLVFAPTGSSPDFWMLDVATKVAKPLTSLSEKGRQKTFDITPDSKYIVFDRTPEHSDIVLIERSK